jgi:hypothetical protein
VRSTPGAPGPGTTVEPPSEGVLDEAAHGSADESDDHEHEPEASGDHHAEPAAEAAAEPVVAPAGSHAEREGTHDRFSLFSWIRREAPPAREERVEAEGTPKEPSDR